MTIDCDDCALIDTDACEDCVVTFILASGDDDDAAGGDEADDARPLPSDAADITFDDVAFQLLETVEFEARQVPPQVLGRVHQFGRRRPARLQFELLRGVALEQEDAAGPETRDDLGVNPPAQRRRRRGCRPAG